MSFPAGKVKLAGRSRVRRILVLLALLAVAYTGVVYWLIARQSAADETRKAEAIVVFGAAEYAGRPSPIYRARLDHAFQLYQRGLAPIVITTGGHGGDPDYTEGGVGRDYLKERGIADQNIIAETQGDSTAESAGRVAAIMKANGMRTCLAVSDDYHIFRIKQMLGRHGIEVYGSPRQPAQPASRWQRARPILREVLSYTLWLMGSERLPG